VDTKITAKGLMQLKANSNLTNLFLSRTGIGAQDFNTVKLKFPKAVIDTGGYNVPFIATDTQQLHPKTDMK
jgi:hypothetical protein